MLKQVSLAGLALLLAVVVAAEVEVQVGQAVDLPPVRREELLQLTSAEEDEDVQFADGPASEQPSLAVFSCIEGDEELDLASIEGEGENEVATAESTTAAGELTTARAEKQQEKEDSSWPASSGMDFTDGEQNNWNVVRLFHGRYYHRMYNRINDYLVDATNSTSVEANMQAARQWLQRERDGGVNIFKNQATTEALKQLLALDTIRGRCDRYSYAILWRNDRATSGEAHRRTSKMSPVPRRIISLVHKVSLRHAIDCHHVYPQSYLRIRQQADQLTLAKAETFLNAVINEHLASKNSLASLLNRQVNVAIDPMGIVCGIKSLRGKKIAQIAYETIRAYSVDFDGRVYLQKVNDEKRGRLIVDQEGVRSLVRMFLVEPCQYYMEQFGPDVYKPAMYEARMLEPEDRYSSLEGQLLDGFVYGWIRYKLCESLVNKDQEKLALGVMAIVNKQK